MSNISYIAKRFREGEFLCYDVIAEGHYMNIFLPNGAPMRNIEQEVSASLENPFPEQRTEDQVLVVYPEPLPEPKVEEKPIPVFVFPEGNPVMKWKAVELQNYMAFHGIDYSDGDTKRVMLEKIQDHFAA
jgi:hypothetical protein